MSHTNDQVWQAALTRVLLDEGGVADVGDGKGKTAFGQTPEWLFHHNLKEPTTHAEARQNYLTVLRHYGVVRLPVTSIGLAYAIATVMVHTGENRGIRFLQEAINEAHYQKIQVDGIIGPQTIEGLRVSDESRLATYIVASYVEFLADVVAANPARQKFLRGWMRRAMRVLRRVVVNTYEGGER